MTLAGAATGKNASSTCSPVQRSLEVLDVALELGLPGVIDRPNANRVRPGRSLLVRVELGIELGKARPDRRRAEMDCLPV